MISSKRKISSLGTDSDKNLNQINEWINPVEGTITSSYGSRSNPILNKGEFHDGLDISVSEGTKVKAVKDGKVIQEGNSKTFGYFVKYSTNDGYTIMYAHLSKILLKKGDNVKKGETVALSGNTGLSTGPHLHYSLWENDVMIDPMNYIDLPYTAEVKQEYEQRGEKLN